MFLWLTKKFHSMRAWKALLEVFFFFNRSTKTDRPALSEATYSKTLPTMFGHGLVLFEVLILVSVIPPMIGKLDWVFCRQVFPLKTSQGVSYDERDIGFELRWLARLGSTFVKFPSRSVLRLNISKSCKQLNSSIFFVKCQIVLIVLTDQERELQ